MRLERKSLRKWYSFDSLVHLIHSHGIPWMERHDRRKKRNIYIKKNTERWRRYVPTEMKCWQRSMLSKQRIKKIMSSRVFTHMLSNFWHQRYTTLTHSCTLAHNITRFRAWLLLWITNFSFSCLTHFPYTFCRARTYTVCSTHTHTHTH